MKPGDKILGQNFLVLKWEVKETKKGKPYVDANLRDIDGNEYEGAKWWGAGAKLSGVVTVSGAVEEFNGAVQIRINTASQSDVPVLDFAAKAPHDIDVAALNRKFSELLMEVEHEDELCQWVVDYIEFWGGTVFPSMFCVPPRFDDHQGAQAVHHAYRHGLLEHTVEVMQNCYDLGINQGMDGKELQLLLMAAAIHDVGKLNEFMLVNAAPQYTPYAKAMGWDSNAHLQIGSQMLTYYHFQEENVPGDGFAILQNAILSHHGQFGLVKPRYAICHILHAADMASSQANRILVNLARHPEEQEISRDKVRDSYIRIS